MKNDTIITRRKRALKLLNDNFANKMGFKIDIDSLTFMPRGNFNTAVVDLYRKRGSKKIFTACGNTKFNPNDDEWKDKTFYDMAFNKMKEDLISYIRRNSPNGQEKK